jgi:hypothetical protein
LAQEGRMHAAVRHMIEIADHGPRSNVDVRSFRREELYERG